MSDLDRPLRRPDRCPLRAGIVAIVLLGALAAGCQGGGASGQGDPAPEAVDPTLSVAPLPYTAAQIREAHPSGTAMRFRVTQPSGSSLQRMRFSESNTAGVTVEMVTLDAGGATVGRPNSSRATWRELQSHAAFPARNTARERADCVVPAGEYACWHYVVSDRSPAGQRVVSHYWFADRKPGPPVRLVRSVDGQEIYRMELVDYRRGPAR